MAYVYLHKRLDKDEVFYVGIGKNVERAYQSSKTRRNKIWLDIVSKTDYEIEIVASDLSWDEACKIEMELIKKYGRKDKSTGVLANMTDGGDGSLNRTSWNKGLSGYVGFNKGHRWDDEYKKKQSIAKQNKYKMEMNPRAKVVLDTYNGIFYDCLKQACVMNNRNYNTENTRINSKTYNSRFKYI